VTLANGSVVVTWDSGRYAQEPGFSNRDEEVMQRLIRFGGNNGDDSMAGGTGIDLIFGESGNDKLWGGDADDTLVGATGLDTFFGDAGIDRIFGGLGNDTASGGLQADTLLGESGADTLDGGSAADTLLGGSGQDWANYTNAAGVAVTIDLSFGAAQSGTGSEGFGDVLIDIGEVMALGRNGDRAWQAAIAAPDGAELARIGLSDRALATSSPAGTRIGGGAPHILHPTGLPPRWTTVAVSAPDAATADALSTAFCLMGRDEIAGAIAAFPTARVEELS